MLSLFEWNDDYVMNIGEIDRQHRMLVDLINELYNSMTSRRDRTSLTELLRRLIDYARYHFDTEEKYMEQLGYSGYAEHKNEHDRFRYRMFEFERDYMDGTIDISMDLLNYLKSWFTDHMLGTDSKFVPFLREKGIR